MLETKHTPGPWKLGIKYRNLHDSTVQPIDAHGIVNLAHIFITDKDREECEANAALITAAPDLLNAVDNLPKWLREAAEALEAYANRNGATNVLYPKLNWYADKIEAATEKALGL
jgi:hypothetical protein